VGGVIAVNQALAEWSEVVLGLPSQQIWYIPNFVYDMGYSDELPTLPGTNGKRIVCVANLRAEKDHISLLKAIKVVIGRMPSTQLLLVGRSLDQEYANSISREIENLKLKQNVHLLGEQRHVSAILRASDIGVLSSTYEGLPLALLEYGTAGLPVVATNVGQCAEVLDDGRAGILVPPASPEFLADALLSLLQSSERRSSLGRQLQGRVQQVYSASSVTEQICRVYEAVLKVRKRRRPAV
jgi:glycosyltransferase involved in cell wall biosynthesis